MGFTWSPVLHQLWFTDNGRDWMGDEMPADELNYAPTKNLNFGFPYVHGHTPDPEFGKQHSAKEFTPPALELPAHVAPLGIMFLPEINFPSNIIIKSLLLNMAHGIAVKKSVIS